MAEIEIDGLEPLLDAFDAAPEIVGPELERASNESLLDLIPDLAAYPQEPPNSRYRRTRTLGRTWTAARPEFQLSGSGFEGTMGNPTPYGPFVQDASAQAPIHQDRWTTADDVLVAKQPRIEQRFEDAADRIAAKLEGK